MGRLVSENKCFWLFSGGLGQLAIGYWLLVEMHLGNIHCFPVKSAVKH